MSVHAGVVVAMPALLTDANGIPRGHYAARDNAAKALREWVNELPSIPYLGLDDAEDAMNIALTVYLSTLRQEQR